MFADLDALLNHCCMVFLCLLSFLILNLCLTAISWIQDVQPHKLLTRFVKERTEAKTLESVLAAMANVHYKCTFWRNCETVMLLHTSCKYDWDIRIITCWLLFISLLISVLTRLKLLWTTPSAWIWPVMYVYVCEHSWLYPTLLLNADI